MRRTDHGIEHWRRVEQNVRDLAEQTPGCDLAVAVAFARLHDTQRQSEHDDPDHGRRASAYALLHHEKLGLTQPWQLTKLLYACSWHDRGLTTDDPTIGVCWDADRLDLPRVGVTPHPKFMSTNAGRHAAQFMYATRIENLRS
jgi:uncharacterized protein